MSVFLLYLSLFLSVYTWFLGPARSPVSHLVALYWALGLKLDNICIYLFTKRNKVLGRGFKVHILTFTQIDKRRKYEYLYWTLDIVMSVIQFVNKVSYKQNTLNLGYEQRKRLQIYQTLNHCFLNNSLLTKSVRDLKSS